MPWTRLSASCSSSSSSVCSRTKLCSHLGSAFSIGDGARDEPELNCAWSRPILLRLQCVACSDTGDAVIAGPGFALDIAGVYHGREVNPVIDWKIRHQTHWILRRLR